MSSSITKDYFISSAGDYKKGMSNFIQSIKERLSDEGIKFIVSQTKSSFTYYYFKSKNKEYKHINFFLFKNFYGRITSIRVQILDSDKNTILLEEVKGDGEIKELLACIDLCREKE